MIFLIMKALNSIFLTFTILLTIYGTAQALQLATVDDGSRIIVYPDKSWSNPTKNINIKTSEKAVEGRVTLTHANDSDSGDDFSNKIEMRIEYQNKTDKTIIGVASDITVQNIFGKIIYETTAEQEMDLPPSDEFKSPPTVFIYKKGFGNETYSALFSPAISGKYKIRITPKVVIFEDGTRLEAKEAKNGR